MLFDKDVSELFSSDFIKKIIKYLEKNDMPLPSELQEGYGQILLENSDEDEIESIKKELVILVIKQKLEEISEKIKTNENNEEYLKEFSVLSKKLSAL